MSRQHMIFSYIVIFLMLSIEQNITSCIQYSLEHTSTCPSPLLVAHQGTCVHSCKVDPCNFLCYCPLLHYPLLKFQCPQLSAIGVQQPPLFGPCLLWPRSPISATAELLLPYALQMHSDRCNVALSLSQIYRFGVLN